MILFLFDRHNEEVAARNQPTEQSKDIEMKDMGGATGNAGDVNKTTADGDKSTPNVEVRQAQCKKKKPRLFWSMAKTFWFKCLVAAIFKVIFDLLQFVSPLILK